MILFAHRSCSSRPRVKGGFPVATRCLGPPGRWGTDARERDRMAQLTDLYGALPEDGQRVAMPDASVGERGADG
jgi:hypothetical protein